MNRPAIAFLLSLILVPGILNAQDSKRSAVLEEYCKRAAKLPPRDANAHFSFYLWCSANSFANEAGFYLKETLVIDEDHSDAREALGYARYGSSWVLKTKLAKRTGKSSPASRSSGAEKTPELVITKAPPVAEAEAPLLPADPSTGEEAGTEDSELVVDATSYSADVTRKKEWAASLAENLNIEFQTYEDQDFLIHTTLSSARHAKVGQLLAHLKAAKKLLGTVLGAKGKDALLWPAKVQIVLLRSEQQFQQFAEVVDMVDYAKNPESGYTKEEHTAIWQPDSTAALRILATDAVKYIHGTDRQAGWWLSEGVAELVIGMLKSKSGKDARDKSYFLRNYKTTADILGAQNNEDNIYYLLEAQVMKRRQERRSRAMAMTLVDFLYRTRKVPRFLGDLKGPEAPAAPPEDDADALKVYWLSYVNFQEKTLKTHFKKETEELDLLWKRHVLEMAKKYSPAADQRGRYPNIRGRNRND